MPTRKTNTRAKQLRALARAFERGSHSDEFTCVAVRATCGRETKAAYVATFELDCVNERKLWDMPPRRKLDMRVTMLCFAAAMAETGDLTETGDL